MSIWENQVLRLVGNKAKRRISKRVFQENKARQIFRKRKRGKKCFFFFRKFGVLCFHETPVVRFALLPYYRRTFPVGTIEAKHS